MNTSKLDCFKHVFILGTIVLSFIVLPACSKKSSLAGPDSAGGQLAAKDIYVAVNGNDSNPGTLDKPVNTIKKGLELVTPGFTVFVRTGTYKEKVVFPKSGRKDKVITLKPYQGEKAVISGEGLSVSGSEALVTMNGVSFVAIEGMDVCNFKTSAAWVNVDGIVVKGGSTNVTLRKNRVYNIENNAAAEMGRSGHAIHVIGNTDVVMTKILVEENEIFDCNTGYSENLTVNGYVDGFEVRKNKIYNGENIGIVAAGGYAANTNPALNYVRNGIIADNEVFNIDGKTGPISAFKDHNGAIGIYVDGARNIIVERNLVRDCGRGIGIVSETDNFPTQECVVRNNLVYNCALAGIYLGGYIGYTGGGTNNCYVVNNTIYHNSKDLGYFNEVEGEVRLTENCNNNVINNNIICPRADRGVFINKQVLGGTNNVITNNLYYSQGLNIWRWDNIPYTDFNLWKAACGGDAGSVSGTDPQFVNTVAFDFHLKPTSPAKNTGGVTSALVNGTTDKDGQTRIVNNLISKGAYQ
ncbi:right-handed parallel beta-helix repeat-containing protein [Pedobacter nyackensis]|uniref:right-handed parallel beta-helix repeat-containing protein n=1 Tax=Pedobacter nyackensis TaxID=475255 RepID=UPI00292DD678|nr:right-handed parallel beta-helix repeat-containing protein [Pedobacter nyackensis]